MQAPLVKLKEKIEQFKDSMQNSLVALTNGLKQRSEATKAREVLELLLDMFHVVQSGCLWVYGCFCWAKICCKVSSYYCC
ncbi:hypothetical protein FF1_034351 [Malus domestica]